MRFSVLFFFGIGDTYGREVRVVQVDFAKGQEVYSDIQAEISDLDIAVLGEGFGHFLS